jgi:hypothetical protein
MMATKGMSGNSISSGRSARSLIRIILPDFIQIKLANQSWRGLIEIWPETRQHNYFAGAPGTESDLVAGGASILPGRRFRTKVICLRGTISSTPSQEASCPGNAAPALPVGGFCDVVFFVDCAATDDSSKLPDSSTKQIKLKNFP